MMRRMEAVAVDPRTQTWEVDRPLYRVYFHDAEGVSDQYEVTGADVDEVIVWAEAQRGPRTYVLYVCVASDGLGLLRLAGNDPHAPELPTGPSPVGLLGSTEPDVDQ